MQLTITVTKHSSSIQDCRHIIIIINKNKNNKVSLVIAVIVIEVIVVAVWLHFYLFNHVNTVAYYLKICLVVYKKYHVNSM